MNEADSIEKETMTSDEIKNEFDAIESAFGKLPLKHHNFDCDAAMAESHAINDANFMRLIGVLSEKYGPSHAGFIEQVRLQYFRRKKTDGSVERRVLPDRRKG